MKLNYKKIIIDDITINIAKSRCRTLHIYIRGDDEVFAVAPKYVTDEEFMNFINSKMPWVKKTLNKLNSTKNIENINMTISELKTKISYYIDKYKDLMGVSIEKVSLRNMKTMWGSCTKTNRTIRFSTMLAKRNDSFIEYVVVHEMAHLIEANHSKNFWNIVAKYIPDYKARKNS